MGCCLGDLDHAHLGVDNKNAVGMVGRTFAKATTATVTLLLRSAGCLLSAVLASVK